MVPELVLGELPAGSHVLIMTHDHAEDAALCDAALRCGHLGSIGLIGSAVKWGRFARKLAAEGHDAAALARITTPIGLPEITGKEPAAIAVSVAADLLRRLEREAAARPPAHGSVRRGDDPRRGSGGGAVTVYRGTVLDTPDSPFHGGGLRAEADAGIAVEAGVVVDRGPFARVRAARPDDEVVDLAGGVLLPGLVDTHVHFPQVRVIGGLGKPLLDWLDGRALPEEARMSDVDYAGVIAADFVDGLARAGTTTALVFGAHFAPAVDVLFERAAAVGLRSPPGSSSATGCCGPSSLTTPERAYADGRRLAERWHGKERLRYAVTPRFSLATTPRAAGELRGPAPRRRRRPLHLARQREPGRDRRGGELFPECAHYVDTYDRFGLLGRRSVLAHNVHPTDAELDVLAGTGASVAHCPSSNSALGSGLFPLRRHVERGVRVALGTDVGAGTGFSLLREGLQAYFMQRCSAGRAAAHVRAPALAGDAGRGGRVGPRRRRRPLRRQPVRRRLGAPAGGQHARPGARPRRRRRRRVGQGLRPGLRRRYTRLVGGGRPGPFVIVERNKNFA